MKTILIFLVTLASVNAFAEEPKVEITSFVLTGSRTRTAELCGKVTGSTREWLAVRVAVDPKTERPGIYNTLVGKDGKFCTTVVTYAGEADASIGWGSEKEVISETAVLVRQVSR